MDTQINSNPIHPSNDQGLAFPDLITKMAKDMTFLSIIIVIYGAFSCLSIIGAAFGIPYIFAGFRLKESARNFKNYALSQSSFDLQAALERQQRFFYLFKVLTIVGIVLAIIIMIVYFYIIINFISNGQNIFKSLNDMAYSI